MRTFGLIGFPLTHSFSQNYFTTKFEQEAIKDSTYELFPLENIDDVRLLFEVDKNLCGLNVTIPFKESIINYLDELDPVAEAIGAVNCIKIEDPEFTRIKKGFNTDWLGFRDAISPLLQNHHSKALILGNGGSAKAIAYALKEMGIEFINITRNALPGLKTYSEIDNSMMEEFNIIINCTPVGMFPNINSAPNIPYEQLTQHHICFELIYNPQTTLFMQKAQSQGAIVKNGLEMLHLQANHAWNIWNEE